MAKIGLFGATGAIGRSVIDVLRRRELSFRPVGRKGEILNQLFGSDPLAEPAVWNPDDPESVRRAADGLETIIYLVGVPYHRFDLHPQLMKQTLDGAVAAGVKQLLLIGTLYPFGPAQRPKVSEDHPREPNTFKGRMRKEQEDIVLQAHTDRHIQTSIIRLPDFYGPGVSSSFLHGVFTAAANGSRAQMIGPIDKLHEFVYVPDVGPVICDLISRADAFGRTWNLGGYGMITQRDVARQAFAVAGTKPRFFVAGKTLLRLAGLMNPIMRELLEMHYLVTNPIEVDDSALRQLLGPIMKTPYNEGIRASVNHAKARARQ